MIVDGAIQCKRGAHSHFDGTFVQNGESSGQAEAHRADVGVRRIAETRGAPTEDFCACEQLDVDFQADDGLVFRQNFRRERDRLWSGFRHKETKIIAERVVSSQWSVFSEKEELDTAVARGGRKSRSLASLGVTIMAIGGGGRGRPPRRTPPQGMGLVAAGEAIV